ncbi:Sentrin-specific protease 1 [Merluccius polli]|uniref:Sentrin-specific protease 1 n=1 Tax=Merluccius polli TaxID=89951 RepID=A0AA47NAG4_MERPO|nr:Sentrin-specific protease 1 [Merluccius polli]
MMNKIYEWIGTGFASLRDGAEPATHAQDDNARARRKRPMDSLEDGDDDVHEDGGGTAKKSRIGELIDSVRGAAGGVKDHGSTVATWVKNSMSPTLRSMLPGPPPPPPTDPQPAASTSTSTSTATWTSGHVARRNSGRLDNVFAAPSTPLEWKLKSDSYRNEKSVMGSKVCRRQVCMNLAHREVAKTNGHPPVQQPPPSTAAAAPTSASHLPLRLGRPLSLHTQGTSMYVLLLSSSMKNTSAFVDHLKTFFILTTCSPLSSSVLGPASNSYTSMYEKTFPIRVVQSPTHSSSGRLPAARGRCTAQESVREEEKEVYRQLLNMVSYGQSSFLNGGSPGVVRSHRDFSSFLSSSRLLRFSPSEAAEGSSDRPGMGPSSHSSGTIPGPVEASGEPGALPWSPELSPTGAASIQSVPSPGGVQDTSSQDTQSSAHDGDSVIIVKEQKGKKTTSVPCFQAELWIKELTSMYDSRARERRRRIEEQEALAARLLHQRLSGDGRRVPKVEVYIRVPLEKEVPLTPLIEEPKEPEEKPEFPELVEEMEDEVSRALRGGSSHEVLSEGFGLSLTRKDLQTLSNLNWLNDEVINFYMNLLVQRSKSPGLPSVDTFNTFFYPKLLTSGYSAVRRWTKKMDIFAADILLVPIHLGMHWCLSVVDFRKKVIMYYDSMGGNNDEACQTLLQYLKQESKDKKGKELDTSSWTLHSRRRHEIPQQMNGSDCGMFTCKYAEYITKDKAITFTQVSKLLT